MKTEKYFEKRQDNSGNTLLVDWTAKKVVTKGVAKGTYFKTFYDENTFANWRIRKEIKQQYPQIISITS